MLCKLSTSVGQNSQPNFRMGFAQKVFKRGVATEGRPYNRSALHAFSSRFVGVALRGHPSVHFCAKLSGWGGVNYDTCTADRVVLQRNQCIVNLIEWKRLHVCTDRDARCFKQKLLTIRASVVSDAPKHPFTIDQ